MHTRQAYAAFPLQPSFNIEVHGKHISDIMTQLVNVKTGRWGVAPLTGDDQYPEVTFGPSGLRFRSRCVAMPSRLAGRSHQAAVSFQSLVFAPASVSSCGFVWTRRQSTYTLHTVYITVYITVYVKT